MERRVARLACGLVLLAASAGLIIFCAERPRGAPVAFVPAEGLPARRAPLAAPGEQPGSSAQWSRRLAREDDLLVAQAVSAGCDAERAEKLRDLLSAKRHTRERTIADYEAGRITETRMHETARAAKREFDEAARKLLSGEELGALDPTAARAQVLLEEKQPR